jgi:hypothetical protein
MNPEYHHRLRIQQAERAVKTHAAVDDARVWIASHRRSEPDGSAIMRRLLTVIARHEEREARRMR